MEFKLSPHEVVRGVKVRDGALVLRPSAPMLLGTWLDVFAGVALAVVFARVGGWWNYLAVPYFALLGIDGLTRARTAVVATRGLVVVCNRRSTRRIPIAKISRVRVDTVDWFFRQPVYAFLGWWPHREWSVGTIDLMDGTSVQCDALISTPSGRQADRSQPNPVESKIAALHRWIAETEAAESA